MQVDALLSRRNSHSEHESLREMKNEFAAVWDGIRYVLSSQCKDHGHPGLNSSR